MSILPETDARREALGPELAIALCEAGELERASQVLAQTRATDTVSMAFAAVVASLIDALRVGLSNVEERHSRLEAAREVLEEAGHDEGLGLYWRCVAIEHWEALHAAETIAALERGLQHFRHVGTYGPIDELVWWIRAAYVHGPMPVAQALERVAAQDELVGTSVLREADSAAQRARLLAMRGDIDEARELLRAARETYRAAGIGLKAAIVAHFTAFVEHRAGDAAAQEQAIRTSLTEHTGFDSQSYAVSNAVFLAELLFQQGRFEESGELCTFAREHSAPDDLVNFVYADAVEGCLLAHKGRAAEALRLGRRALERADSTDFFGTRVAVRLLAAENHDLNGLTDEAARLAMEGVEIAVAKGDVTGAARARERIAQLGIEVP